MSWIVLWHLEILYQMLWILPFLLSLIISLCSEKMNIFPLVLVVCIVIFFSEDFACAALWISTCSSWLLGASYIWASSLQRLWSIYLLFDISTGRNCWQLVQLSSHTWGYCWWDGKENVTLTSLLFYGVTVWNITCCDHIWMGQHSWSIIGICETILKMFTMRDFGGHHPSFNKCKVLLPKGTKKKKLMQHKSVWKIFVWKSTNVCSICLAGPC